MKPHLLALLLALPAPAFAQLEGEWYGQLPRNRQPAAVVLHLRRVTDGYAGTVDFPAEGKTALPLAEVFSEAEAVSGLLAEARLGLDLRLNPARTHLAGQATLNGRRVAVSFGRKPESIPEPATSPPTRSIGENGLSPDYDTPRPIAAGTSLFIEELTWLDVRDALRAGKNTVIVATGGTEQSGPYVVTGKHNFILRVATEAIARQLGNALVAPIVPFVPEGDFSPPSGHLKYPGSISLREETYEALLTDIVTSYKVEGFRTIVLLGDSGGNQWGMFRVARALNRRWQGEVVRVVFVPEYYDNDRLSAWLGERGIHETSEGIHDSFKVEAQLLVLNPDLIRAKERAAANRFSINGVPLSVEKTGAVGRELIEYQANFTADLIRQRSAKAD